MRRDQHVVGSDQSPIALQRRPQAPVEHTGFDVEIDDGDLGQEVVKPSLVLSPVGALLGSVAELRGDDGARAHVRGTRSLEALRNGRLAAVQVIDADVRIEKVRHFLSKSGPGSAGGGSPG